MASNSPAPEFKNPVVRWVDTRLPVFTMMSREYGVFPTPRNFNYFWNFGAIAMVMLMLMIVTGIVLAMAYTPHVDYAFDSVERIMRDVNWGWLIRYLHMNGASFFFIAVFIHIFRGLYYGSYKAPRELLWMLGVVILLLMMATAFMGYVLPWGQMSFWGATVITNLFSAIPLVGDSLVTWLWGGFAVDNPTLNRFFALHFLLPFVILGVVVLHVAALHVTGSNNPLGIEPQTEKDTLPFHPYYTSKDMFGLTVFLMVFAAFVFFAPNYLGHPDNYIEANPLQTPPHIVPEWYFLPFYAILRAITFDIGLFGVTIIEAKLGGVLLMFGSIGVLFILPWLDTSKVRSAKFRPVYKWFFWLLVLDCIVLGYVGAKPPEGILVLIGQISTAYYFFHFLILLPLLGRFERPLTLPSSIAESVLSKKGGKAGASGATAGATASLIALAVAGGLALGLFGAPKPAEAAGEAQPVPQQEWSFFGLFGTYDQAAAQRGLTVYQGVCAACHGLEQVAFRSLADIGFSEEQIKAIAAEYTITDGPNDDGEMYERAGIPADHFPSPFPNEQAAAAANGGAAPPDLSLVSQARAGGPDYIAALMQGYRDFEPYMIEEYHLKEDFKMGATSHFNIYFPGYQIAMAPPIAFDGQVEYLDGTEATIEQMSHDVAVFLHWAAEPNLDERHNLGWKVLMVLIILAGVLYAAKRKIWSDVEH